jgi:phosphate transport system substrate-binding protein
MNINSCKNLVLILLCLGLMSGCNPNRGTTGSESAPGTAGSSPAVSLQGAGATFPNPLYQKWLSEYSKQNPNVKIDYQSIGSGGGVKQLLAQTVDFGASDDPMKDEDLKKAPGEIIHIPTVLGAVAIAYNLADVKEKLKLSSDLLADIFLGKIKKWNDARIKSANPGLNLT